ncbi:UTP-glucose-1-phosphate uridylyltransferase [Spironucleus salmonicida]|uniref:UTP--glucose-1-phosphate uridylyltransferase n=1 Tax=Spironucleus salmonicida TaxID=348837 RepID=V6LEP8_9EUKA|nr:UTP-glucose-1-phosphate uridylyltransferase [Spironucleus salmonicida]|eukprot:EST43000.1 UTP-glucose-1-phosphate uridylyltransferase [Spironucleus salmonicida]
MSEYYAALKASLTTLLQQKKITQMQFDSAYELYSRYQIYIEQDMKINWSKVKPVSDSNMQKYQELSTPSEEQIKQSLKQVAVLKLNGGLGTSMGCDGPKSLLPVRDGLCFLDFTVKQIEFINKKYDISVPLVLMNSFNTETQTKEHLSNVKNVELIHFNQFELPRMDASTKLPVECSESAKYYPPGHGYVYECLKQTGTLQKLVERGIKWIFISNSDNLGAVLDEKIATFVTKSQFDFLSEQTPKTLADVKGGILMDYEGQTRLLETAQVPPENIKDFCDIVMFKSFNVNNLWINAESLLKVEKLDLDIIVNPKKAEGISVIQLEVAAGAAISSFKKVTGLQIPRERFAPVKKSSDLLILQSDCFKVKDNFQLVSTGSAPLVTINCNVVEFQEMFKNVPSLKDCTKIDIMGKVVVGKNVIIKGSLIVAEGECLILQDNSTYIDNVQQ